MAKEGASACTPGDHGSTSRGNPLKTAVAKAVVLYVLDSSCVTELACNDDYSGLQSQVSTYFSAGTYYIVVDGYSSSTGSYVLNVY